MVQQIAIGSRPHGFFPLSHKAMMCYAELVGLDLRWKIDYIYADEGDLVDSTWVDYWLGPRGRDNDSIWSTWDIKRDDSSLIKAIQGLGSDAGEVKVVEIPDNVEWEVNESEGSEWIAEKHRTWF